MKLLVSLDNLDIQKLLNKEELTLNVDDTSNLKSIVIKYEVEDKDKDEPLYSFPNKINPNYQLCHWDDSKRWKEHVPYKSFMSEKTIEDLRDKINAGIAKVFEEDEDKGDNDD